MEPRTPCRDLSEVRLTSLIAQMSKDPLNAAAGFRQLPFTPLTLDSGLWTLDFRLWTDFAPTARFRTGDRTGNTSKNACKHWLRTGSRVQKGERVPPPFLILIFLLILILPQIHPAQHLPVQFKVQKQRNKGEYVFARFCAFLPDSFTFKLSLPISARTTQHPNPL